MTSPSPIYGIPWPALGAIADGPDGYSDIALRVEREMTTFRGVTNYAKSSGVTCLNGYTTDVHSVTHPLAVIGWVDVELNIAMTPAAGTVIAGTIQITLDAVQVRNVRFHNQGQGIYVATIVASRAVTAAQTTLAIVARLAVDGPSSTVTYQHSEISARSYGAPGTG